VTAITSGLAAALVLLLVMAAVTYVHVANRSVAIARPTAAAPIPMTTVPDPTTTTTLPEPTTTLPEPTTLPIPSVAVPSETAAARLTAPPGPARNCTQPSVPDGVYSTALATPNAPNLPYSATPGGPPVGNVTNPWGGASSSPILDQRNGWVEIRLYSRPNGSVGWLPAANVSITSTVDRIVVSVCQRTLTLFQGSNAVYSAPVGIGRPQWPTPVGPSFVDAIVATPRNELSIYGPTVIMLGTHSNVFNEFEGGDGVVAIHGYPSDPASTRGVMSSHGCIRSSPATVNMVEGVPVGTPVDVIN
jgi:hypothetical protein